MAHRAGKGPEGRETHRPPKASVSGMDTCTSKRLVQRWRPQRAIGSPHRGPGAPVDFLGLRKICVKPCPGMVWGEIGTPKCFLGTMETIPLLTKLRETCGGRFSTKPCFPGHLFGDKKGVRAFLGQDVGSGSQKLVPGSRIPKLCIEEPRRIHRSMPQTEPYVGSDGRTLF